MVFALVSEWSEIVKAEVSRRDLLATEDCPGIVAQVAQQCGGQQREYPFGEPFYTLSHSLIDVHIGRRVCIDLKFHYCLNKSCNRNIQRPYPMPLLSYPPQIRPQDQPKRLRDTHTHTKYPKHHSYKLDFLHAESARS